MRIEILTFDGCPNEAVTRERVREAMLLESVRGAIDVIEVTTPQAAQNLRFLGSPSVRLDGEDIEAAARGKSAYGLMCRTYESDAGTVGAPSLEMIRAAIRRRDVLSDRWSVAVLYGLPIVALVASGSLGLAQGWQSALWAVALTTMGVACVANAMRCGRMHCYFTGPFFLGMAIVTLVLGFGKAPLSHGVWNVLYAIVLGGGTALWLLPDVILGMYRRTPSGATPPTEPR